MRYEEKRMNLFDVDDKYYLTHCISADAGIDDRAMGLGIVVEFNKRFHVKSQITKLVREKGCPLKVGSCLILGKVINLITKSKYYGKPTYNTLRMSLEDLKDFVISENMKHVAMCKIGSGLDKLSWGKVREIIQEVFEDVDVEIIVCSL